jgi:hypothetical protein
MCARRSRAKSRSARDGEQRARYEPIEKRETALVLYETPHVGASAPTDPKSAGRF